MDNRGRDEIKRIRLINEYFYSGSLPCKKCGVLNDFKELIIEPELGSGKKLQYRATCFHCNSFIKYLSTSASPRIWNFGTKEATEIARAAGELQDYHLHNTKLDPFTYEAILLFRDHVIDQINQDLEKSRNQLSLFGSGEHYIDKALKQLN